MTVTTASTEGTQATLWVCPVGLGGFCFVLRSHEFCGDGSYVFLVLCLCVCVCICVSVSVYVCVSVSVCINLPSREQRLWPVTAT